MSVYCPKGQGRELDAKCTWHIVAAQETAAGLVSSSISMRSKSQRVQRPGDPTRPGGVCAEEGFTALASMGGGSPGLWGVSAAASRATFQVLSPAAGLEP